MLFLTILGYLFLGLVYAVIGYHIAIISRKVANDWGMSPPGLFERISLYPGGAMCILDNVCDYKLNGLVSQNFRESPSYVFLHLFGWPFRILFNIALWIFLAIVLTYLLSFFGFLGYLLSNIFRNAIDLIKSK